MSTICKLSAEHRNRKHMRRNLLRTVTPRKGIEAAIIWATLLQVHKSSHLFGDTKHDLFVRGMNQMEKLP